MQTKGLSITLVISLTPARMSGTNNDTALDADWVAVSEILCQSNVTLDPFFDGHHASGIHHAKGNFVKRFNGIIWWRRCPSHRNSSDNKNSYQR